MTLPWDLNTIWFFLIGGLLAGYAMLDGFDLGVGALHLLVRGDAERRIMLNAIGPVWDGNEVWLVTGGGALFAAFPPVYATVFSGFYTAVILLLFMLIFRAVAIEFRSKQPMRWWRAAWDVSFSGASVLIALIMGVALGNVAIGLPLEADGEFLGSFAALLAPYPLLVGVTTLSLFMMHGAIYAVMKTEGELQARLRGWVNNCVIFFVICHVTTTMATLIYQPHMAEAFRHTPALFLVALASMLAIANIPREISRGREFRAFLSSCAAVATLLLLFALGIFPNIIRATNAPERSLTIYTAASSPQTLSTMLIIALIGLPFVLAYTVSIYWIFRGKVRMGVESY